MRNEGKVEVDVGDQVGCVCAKERERGRDTDSGEERVCVREREGCV